MMMIYMSSFYRSSFRGFHNKDDDKDEYHDDEKDVNVKDDKDSHDGYAFGSVGHEILQDGLSEADMDDMVASFLASLTLKEEEKEGKEDEEKINMRMVVLKMMMM